VRPVQEENLFVKTDEKEMKKINDLLVVKIPRKTDAAGVLSIQNYKFMVPDCSRKNVIVALSEKQGVYAVTPDGHRHGMVLLETDSSNEHMPEVQKKLIHEFFLKNAKAKYREVYQEIRSG
jgi:hypothetical protein